MAKVLACPSCGNKHALELLVGLESFQCKQCGRKLAVPAEAISAIKKNDTDQKRTVLKNETPLEKREIQQIDSNEAKSDVVVVAKSSMALDAPSSSKKISDPVKVGTSEMQKGQEPAIQESPKSIKTSIFNIKSARFVEFFRPKVPGLPIPFIGRVVSWLLGVPLGFFAVVLIPRFFGYGFHASDFLGVITNQGLGRYKIVMALVFLWSIATVISVYFCNAILKKLFFAKKLAA